MKIYFSQFWRLEVQDQRVNLSSPQECSLPHVKTVSSPCAYMTSSLHVYVGDRDREGTGK